MSIIDENSGWREELNTGTGGKFRGVGCQEAVPGALLLALGIA